MIKLEDFFLKYPFIELKDAVVPYNDNVFEEVLYNLKEFNDLKLELEEDRPKPGKLLKYQEIIQRFFSPFTPYEGVLLFDEVGTGKTCTTVGVIENLREKSSFKRAVILASGRNLLNNYKNEVTFVCTDGRYVPENIDSLTERERTIRINKKLAVFYEFHTYETFGSELKKGMKNMIKAYENSIFVFDEVHNLKPSKDPKNASKTYETIHEFIHSVTNKKVLLLSATPMRDNPAEIVYPMNLILPLSQQLPTEDEFMKKFYKKNIVSDELYPYFKGRMSYLKALRSNARKIFVGKKIGLLEHFIVEPLNMKPHQENIYKKAYTADETGKEGVWTNSRQATLFVYPDGTYGDTGFSKYVTKSELIIPRAELGVNDKNTYYVYNPTYEFSQQFMDLDEEEKLEKVKQYSAKYGQIIETLLEKSEENHFVYMDLVLGSGAIVFSKLLEQFGYTKANGREKTKGRRYALINNEVSTPKQIKDLVARFNNPDNKNGEYIQLIIGSDVIVEGISLYNVLNIHIVTPHWNYANNEQAIGRAIRAFSHKDLGDNVTIRIHQYVAMPTNKKTPSIDLRMYEESERKDILIKKFEHKFKTYSFDCELTKERNSYSDEFDGTRQCDYVKCDYVCHNRENWENMEIIYDNYDNEYFDVEKHKEKIIDYVCQKMEEIPMNKIREDFPEYTEHELLKIITYISEEKIVLQLPNGLKGYLYMDGNKIYVNDDPIFSSHLSSYYLTNPYLQVKTSFGEMVDSLYLENVDKLLDSLKKEKNKELFEKMLALMIFDVKIRLIEGCILAKRDGRSREMEFIDKIMNYFAPNITMDDDEYIITFKEYDVYRCLRPDTNKWEDCPEKLEKIMEIKEKEKEKLTKNPYGYYGIISTDKKGKTQFKILDLTIPLKKTKGTGEIDKRAPKGKVCTSYSIPELADIGYKLGFRNEDETIEKMSIEQILKKLGEELDDMTAEKVRAIYYLRGLGKAVMCEKIQQFFEDKNLVIKE